MIDIDGMHRNVTTDYNWTSQPMPTFITIHSDTQTGWKIMIMQVD